MTTKTIEKSNKNTAAAKAAADREASRVCKDPNAEATWKQCGVIYHALKVRAYKSGLTMGVASELIEAIKELEKEGGAVPAALIKKVSRLEAFKEWVGNGGKVEKREAKAKAKSGTGGATGGAKSKNPLVAAIVAELEKCGPEKLGQIMAILMAK